MNQREAALLLEKYNNGSATAEEIKLLENWYSGESFTRKLSDRDIDFERLKDEIWQGTLKRANLTALGEHSSPKRKGWTGQFWIAAAAVLILCLGVGYFFIRQNTNDFSKTLTVANRIKAGQKRATLTLANGKKIVLSDAVKGKLAEEAGVSITKTADGQLIYHVIPGKNQDQQSAMMNTISTARGEDYQVVLPDGSKIWLNAQSSLKYPASFAGSKDRKVELNGEAYFEITKDKEHPFKVKTYRQEVEVLGTHFNISSYAGEDGTKTTLLEGSVKISPLSYTSGKEGAALSQYAIMLKPGEQAFQSQGNISVTSADTEQAVAWKEGWFYFKSTSLKNVLREASKWYDLEVIYENNIPSDHFTGKVPRTASLGKFIKMLRLSDIKFRIEGRKIIINQD